MRINKYRTSLVLLSYPSERPGGRVNGGYSRAPKKSATVKKSHLQGGLLRRRRRRLLLLQLKLGADRWEVARPCSVQGKFFRRKFKDRATTKGSLTRSPALVTVGGRCKTIISMEEVSSSSAQRAASLFMEDGWRRFSSLEWIRILCDGAKGRASSEQSPSPVTSERKGAGVTTRPLSTSCGPPHGHGNLDDPGTPPTSSSSL